MKIKATALLLALLAAPAAFAQTFTATPASGRTPLVVAEGAAVLGVKTVDTSITWTGSVTLTAVATAVTALGNGWTGSVTSDYGKWPSADLRAQGALTAWGRVAELKMHTEELAGYQIQENGGWLLRAIPYTDPELMHPEDLIWPVGTNNFRIQYTAGYVTVPEDIQEACANWVSALYFLGMRDPGLSSRSTIHDGTYVVRSEMSQIPEAARALLKNYKSHSIYSFGG